MAKFKNSIIELLGLKVLIGARTHKPAVYRLVGSVTPTLFNISSYILLRKCHQVHMHASKQYSKLKTLHMHMLISFPVYRLTKRLEQLLVLRTCQHPPPPPPPPPPPKWCASSFIHYDIFHGKIDVTLA